MMGVFMVAAYCFMGQHLLIRIRKLKIILVDVAELFIDCEAN